MGKLVELSIKSTYVGNWSKYECIREIVQNAIDAEYQCDAPMSIEYVKRQRRGKSVGAIIVTNTGVTIPEKALLLGHTTKDGDDRLAGKFGEGLALALLSGIRAGFDIKICNGSEVWIPQIVESKTFREDVLAINIEYGRKEVNRIQFEILGVTDEEWADLQSKFLFFKENENITKISSWHGDVLLDKKFHGKMFVKGIFVGNVDGYELGFNFKTANVDRDRKMVSDKDYEISRLIGGAVEQGHLIDYCYNLLKNGKAPQYMSWNISDVSAGKIYELYKKEFGPAVPTQNSEEVTELAHYGYTGVVMPQELRTILERKIGATRDFIEKSRNGVKAVLEISDEQKDTLKKYVVMIRKVQQLIGEVSLLSVDDISIVEFYRPLLGTYNPSTGKINLAKSLFDDEPELLMTLIHECAHKYETSGEKFSQEVEKLTVGIFRQFMKGNNNE